ncbi:metallophosphoesterase [Desulfosporosinus sp. Sb-LF]|uniref:metallophosphoesterase family protein n=1 Tax=Desulfosporosinus sp. Sb-LF TaxID=2560027 RepID=UPI00107F1409|nr:metallophosphoesterase [Desulfosporosinus sp. Sb-LF]TGE31646.1 metallophosphoesterase [Desulfosporosinus sp. Sb-LF]
MRKVLLLLLPFVFLLTATVTATNSAFSLNLPVRSIPAISKPSVAPTSYSPLTPSNEPDQLTSSLLFGVVSDIHVQNTNPVAQNKFQQMLGDMVKLHVSNLIINGDLGDGTPQDYNTLGNLIKQQKNHPAISYTIGNHEFYKAYHNPITNAWSRDTFPNGETDITAVNRFLDFTKRSQVFYDEYLQNYHFIFLGSENSAISDPAYGDKAYLSDKQLAWLELKLKENYSPNKPIFVFLHQPLVRLGSTLSKPDFVIQADRLREILNRFPEVIFFSGHIHRQLELPTTILKQEFVMVNSSSVSLPRDANGHPLPDKSEGLVVEVLKNKVFIKGRDFLTKTWIPGAQYEF